MQPRPLKNPPIREAIFDIQATLGDGATLENLEGFKSRVVDTFPDSSIRVDFQSELEIQGQSIPEKMDLKHNKSGFLLRDNSKQKAVHARLDGFSLSCVGNYSGWSDFSEEAYDLWSIYKETSKPASLNRLALRFINVFDIQVAEDDDEIVDIQDYLQVFPYVGENLGGALESSSLGVHIANEEFFPAKGILRQEVFPIYNEQEEKFFLRILLDIDVYQTVDIVPYNDTEISEIFKMLRKFKNYIFFNTLTEKAVEVIDD